MRDAVLLGRDAELAAIRGMVDRARRGASGALVVRGEAGIGKSTLLRYAAAAAVGFRVLETRGTELESELPFAGLSRLLSRLGSRLGEIPPPQAAALAGALALGPAVPGDRFSAYAGVLSLLAAEAEDGPLLVLVDDAHWLDAASREAIVFAGRRFEAESVVLLIAAREGEGEFPVGVLPELALSGLDERASAALVAARVVAGVSPSVAAELHRATGGNPLALAIAAESLTDDQLAGTEPLDDPLPIGSALERSFLRRIETLDPETQRALLLAAASSSAEAAPLARALASTSLGASAFEPAERAGLISIRDGEIAFHHPLVRSACYYGAAATRRREVHRLLAEHTEEPERRAWHLAAAAVAPDEAVASALDQAATAARERNAHTEAAAAFERAARLSPDAAAAGQRLIEAAREVQLVGRLEDAMRQLDEAMAKTSDPLLRSSIHQLQARIEIPRGQPWRAYELLVAEAERVERDDPSRAASLLAEAVFPCILAGGALLALETARRAVALGGDVDPLVSVALVHPLLVMRREREARPIMLRAADRLENADPIAFHQPLYLLGLSLAVVGEFPLARRFLGRVVAAARANAMPGILPLPLAALGILDFWSGRWGESYAAGSEAVRLAEETGVRLDMVLIWVLFVEGGLGMEDDCRAHAASALREAQRSGDVGTTCWARAAVGKLELGLGRYAQAAEELEEADHWATASGARSVPEWSADRAEAHLFAGSPDQAAAEFAALERWGRENEHPIALAAAARGRLLLADEGDIDEHFNEAMWWYERASTPFEQARARLYYGERLRRAKRLTEARQHLRRALDAFERLGARLWAVRARNELRASGAAVGEALAVGVADLTPQELQVAVAVAKGATNRDAAATLFLSPKTVGFHLGHVYRKLGIRSRVELARLLATSRGVAAPPALQRQAGSVDTPSADPPGTRSRVSRVHRIQMRETS